jgi:hypothetical protein
MLKHCALLGHDEFELVVTHHVDILRATPFVIMRDIVAAKFNLRDWVSFLAALPSQKVVVLVFHPTAIASLTLSEYIQRARFPRRPELTTIE